MYRLVFIAAFTVVAVVACSDNDLNTSCVLVRGNPDGGKAIAILKSDAVIKNSANNDFISFGSAECEDQVCVRDSAFREDAGDTTPEAHGYCSTSCTSGDTTSCSASVGQDSPTTKLSCRALLLDSATLQAIHTAHPDEYNSTFGMTTSPYFCARTSVFGDGGQ